MIKGQKAKLEHTEPSAECSGIVTVTRMVTTVSEEETIRV